MFAINIFFHKVISGIAEAVVAINLLVNLGRFFKVACFKELASRLL
jgi:hypothetical protein